MTTRNYCMHCSAIISGDNARIRDGFGRCGGCDQKMRQGFGIDRTWPTNNKGTTVSPTSKSGAQHRTEFVADLRLAIIDKVQRNHESVYGWRSETLWHETERHLLEV